MKESWEETYNQSIAELKESLGEIPENTCPSIDELIKDHNKIIKELAYLEKNSRHYDNVDDFVKDFPSYHTSDVEGIAEELRKKNEKLRELGREWYKFALETKSFITQLLQEEREGFVEDLKKHKNAADWYDDLEIAIDDLITKYSAPPNPKGEE